MWLGQLTLLLLMTCLLCRTRYGLEGIDTLFGRAWVVMVEAMQCLVSLDWKRCRPTSLCLHPWIESGADQRFFVLHSTLFGLEAVQTNVFVFTFNTLWIGKGADKRFCVYIQHFLDWKGCRPTSLCLHSTPFEAEAVQSNAFVLTFNPFWIGSGADHHLCAYTQHSLDCKRCRPTSWCLHSTPFGLEAVQTNILGWACTKHSTLFGLQGVQTNIFALTLNALWIGSGEEQRLCAYIQRSLDWKRCRPPSLCLHSTPFGLKAVQTNVFVLSFNTVWIGSGATQRLCAYNQHSLEWKRCRPTSLGGRGQNIQPFLDWKRCRPTSVCLHSILFGLEAVQKHVVVLTFNTPWIESGADQRL